MCVFLTYRMEQSESSFFSPCRLRPPWWDTCPPLVCTKIRFIGPWWGPVPNGWLLTTFALYTACHTVALWEISWDGSLLEMNRLHSGSVLGLTLWFWIFPGGVWLDAETVYLQRLKKSCLNRIENKWIAESNNPLENWIHLNRSWLTKIWCESNWNQMNRVKRNELNQIVLRLQKKITFESNRVKSTKSLNRCLIKWTESFLFYKDHFFDLLLSEINKSFIYKNKFWIKLKNNESSECIWTESL